MGVLKSVPDEKQLPRLPLDVQYEIGSIQTDKGPLVVLEMRTGAGEQTYFMPTKFADKLATDLSRSASQANVSSIIVPNVQIPPDLVPPNGNRQSRRHPDA